MIVGSGFFWHSKASCTPTDGVRNLLLLEAVFFSKKALSHV